MKTLILGFALLVPTLAVGADLGALQYPRDADDACQSELTSLACGDTGTALDYAYDLCEVITSYGTPSSVVALCAKAIVTHRDAGIGFGSLALD